MPGADLVTKPDFIQSLKRMDEGLAYFKKNVSTRIRLSLFEGGFQGRRVI